MPKRWRDFVLVHRRIEAVELDMAGGGAEQRGEHLDGGGFAGAVGAEEGEDLPCIHLKGNVFDSGELVKGFGQVFHPDHGVPPGKNCVGIKTICLVCQSRTAPSPFKLRLWRSAETYGRGRSRLENNASSSTKIGVPGTSSRLADFQSSPMHIRPLRVLGSIAEIASTPILR